MPIIGSDIVKRLSVTAAAGDTTAGTPATSLGDQVSTTVITDATIENLFGNVSAADAVAGLTDYRCFFVLNNHATLTYTDVTVSLQSETASGAAVTIATDGTAISAKGASGAQAVSIAAATDVPAGTSAFGAGPLTVGSLAPGQVKGIWVKRVTSAGTAAQNPDGAVLRFSGETLP